MLCSAQQIRIELKLFEGIWSSKKAENMNVKKFSTKNAKTQLKSGKNLANYQMNKFPFFHHFDSITTQLSLQESIKTNFLLWKQRFSVILAKFLAVKIFGSRKLRGSSITTLETYQYQPKQLETKIVHNYFGVLFYERSEQLTLSVKTCRLLTYEYW